MARDRGRRPDYAQPMEDVTVPELREKLDDLLDRVEAGETIRITRDGEPVAELRPIPGRSRYTMAEILEEARKLDPIDLEEFRADLDAILDPYR